MFLDTSFCIDLMREKNKNITGSATKKMLSIIDFPLFISLYVLCELHAGAQLSNNKMRELRKIELLTESLEIVYPDKTFPVLYGEAESYLRKQGTPIPVMDLLIGITAKQYSMPVITRDVDHFSLIPGVVVERY